MTTNPVETWLRGVVNLMFGCAFGSALGIPFTDDWHRPALAFVISFLLLGGFWTFCLLTMGLTDAAIGAVFGPKRRTYRSIREFLDHNPWPPERKP